MPRPRTLRRKLALGAGTAVALLLVSEGVARVVYRGRFPYMYVHDAELGWAHRPGYTGTVRVGVEATFDARGMREERAIGPKQGRRVLVLGDSVAFGHGLGQDETIARALERRAPGLEALNAGVPGYATEQEVRYLARLAPDLRPDVVVLLLCLRNDLGVPPLDPLGAAKDLAPASRAQAWLFDHSALAFALGRALHRQAVRASREDADAEAQFLTPDAVAALPAAAREQVFARARERLASFRDVARRHGARPLLVLCPEELLVAGRVPRALVLDPLLAIARELDLPALDLLPALQAPSAVPLLSEKDGVHPTAAGAERIADALLPFLRANERAP